MNAQRLVLVLASIVAAVPGLFGALTAQAGSDAKTCTQRTLVLSAMPVELGPLVDATSDAKIVSTDAHDYVVGRLRGHAVALSLTGIGPVNARRATKDALAHFRCGTHSAITAIVFSGVAGGDFIGNVTVPARWTVDQGKHFYAVDRSMLAVARSLSHRHVALERTAPAGDPACACVTPPDLVATVAVTHQPHIDVGGDGRTTDPFSGRALPCVPGGGDVFGCAPCVVQTQARDGAAFAPRAVPFLDPAFFTGYFSSTAPSKHHYVADDEETAAVAAVASARGIPFIGFRAVSDGAGDPLHLPGFPAQFFYYRQLAADNAAATTLAFLRAWSAAPGA